MFGDQVTIAVFIGALIVILIWLSYRSQQLRMKNALKYHFSEENYDKARKYYEKEQDNGNVEAMIYLARLYHGGMKDRRPEPRRAIKYYKKAVTRGVYYCLLNIGDIYNYIFQEPGHARRYYLRLIDACERGNGSDLDVYHLEQARQRLEVLDAMMLYGEGGGDDGRGDDDDAIDMGAIMDRARGLAENREFRRGFGDAIRARARHPPRQRGRQQEEDDPRVPTALDNPVVVHNDSQNVHDRGLNQTILNSIQKLRNSTRINIPKNKVIQEVRVSAAGTAPAIQTIDSLNDIPVGGSGMSEKDILHLVWNRIQNYKAKEDRANATENLIRELSEASEGGITVCSSGKFNRIIDSLNKIDEEVEIRPTWAMNQEMMQVAARLREQMLEEIPDDEEFSKKFKDRLMARFEKDYVESGVITREDLVRQTSSWIDHI